MKPRFFKTPAAFRKWLSENHQCCSEKWIGFYKKGSGKPSITWPESVDVALCYGWIDGLRKSIDDQSYQIRFTPRRPTSHWSTVNIARVKELRKLGLMCQPGLAAFAKRTIEKSARASYEQKTVRLSSAYKVLFQQNKIAWLDFQNRAPSYRKQCIWWIMSAKREQTRLRRLNTLIESCQNADVIPTLKWTKKQR